jgi:hypothetical protein
MDQQSPSEPFVERRRHVRVPLAGVVSWRSHMWDRDLWGSAAAVDVSLGGLCMAVVSRTPRPPSVGDVLDLTVPLGLGDDDAVHTRALVVGAEESDGGVTCRVAFRTLDDESTRRLARICAPASS